MTARRRTGARRPTVTPDGSGEIILAGPTGSRVRLADADLADRLARTPGWARVKGADHDDTGEPTPAS